GVAGGGSSPLRTAGRPPRRNTAMLAPRPASDATPCQRPTATSARASRTTSGHSEGSRTISEIVRLPSLWPLVVLLALALVAVGRWQGVASLAGLGASIAVFLLGGLPAVRSGDDPPPAT